jgi:hypothetical protein
MKTLRPEFTPVGSQPLPDAVRPGARQPVAASASWRRPGRRGRPGGGLRLLAASYRPTVVVADGLVAFLEQDALVTLLNRLADLNPGFDDPHDPRAETTGSPWSGALPVTRAGSRGVPAGRTHDHAACRPERRRVPSRNDHPSLPILRIAWSAMVTNPCPRCLSTVYAVRVPVAIRCRMWCRRRGGHRAAERRIAPKPRASAPDS